MPQFEHARTSSTDLSQMEKSLSATLTLPASLYKPRSTHFSAAHMVLPISDSLTDTDSVVKVRSWEISHSHVDLGVNFTVASY